MFTKFDKALTTAVGVVLMVLTLLDKISFLPGHTTIGVILAILTPIATYLVPNKAKTA